MVIIDYGKIEKTKDLPFAENDKDLHIGYKQFLNHVRVIVKNETTTGDFRGTDGYSLEQVKNTVIGYYSQYGKVIKND